MLDDILSDPETHTPLTRASDAELAKLREAIASGSAKRRDRSEVPAFDGAYLTKDRKAAYLIEEGIPNFVVAERIELDRAL